MTTIKISQLPDATTPLTGAEVFPLDQNGITKKVAIQSITVFNQVANFFGTGSQLVFVLPAAPVENNTNVYINGVYQQKNTYSISAGAITFSQAPPFTSRIEVMYN